jgi:AraC family transcriptional regulator, activator of mtrCDE
MRQGSAYDPLSGLAPLLRVRPELQDFCRFGGAWEAPHEPAAKGAAYFHIVTRGQCLLDRPGHGSLRLQAGDILLLPHGDAHVTRSRALATRAARPISIEYHNAIRAKTITGVEPDTELICGLLHFEQAPENLLVAALPDVIVVHSGERHAVEFYRALMSGIRDELDGGRAGAVAVATDLASALFVMLLRAHLEEHPPADGLLALLSQPMTARAVTAMLKDPSFEWTLDALAAHAVTSRATLVRCFRRACGLAPLAFLSELRLGLARRRLANTADPIAQIGAALGYQSEGAFSRAFHRRFGIRPGKLRGERAAAERSDR